MRGMEPLSHLESFVQSAEVGSFSAAARRLGLTPAAVSKNVARLEASLGVRLFQRSTRSLDADRGRRAASCAQVSGGLATLQDARGQPGHASTASRPARSRSAWARPSVAPMSCRCSASSCARYPAIVPDWHFDNRQVDLIGEGFDAAIGGGIELPPGVVARELARVARGGGGLARATWRAGRRPVHPSDLAALRRHRAPLVADRAGCAAGRCATRPATKARPTCRPRVDLQRPRGHRAGRAHGPGRGAAADALCRRRPAPAASSCALLPGWAADMGPLSLYYPSKKLLPAKTRVFVDFVVERFRDAGFAQRMQGD